MYNGFIKLQKEMINTKILIYVVVFFIYSVLKPFVDDFLYNMFAATYGPGTDTTALYYGLCAGIFAVSAYACARWLCKRWDKKQSSKGQRISHTEEVSEAIAPEAEIIEPTPTITDPSSPAPVTPKLRYCKLCGAPIDPTTRKCTDCRKQYFRPPVLRKKHLFIGAAALVCAAVVMLTVNLVSQKNVALYQVDELAAQITELEKTVAEKEQQIRLLQRDKEMYQSKLTQKSEAFDALRKENTMYREHLRYCEDYCAYIVPTSISGINSGGLYHRLSCPYAGKIDNLVMIEIGFLESKGYKPCSHCYN